MTKQCCKKGKKECCKRLKHVKRCPTECKTFCGCEARLTVTIHKPAKKFRVHKEKCEKKCHCRAPCQCANKYLCCDRFGCGYNFGLDFVNDH